MKFASKWHGGYWPTPSQNLLLHAALLSGEPALNAWRAMRAGLNLERLDPGSRRLLPLLYRNLAQLGVDDPLLPKLKQTFSHTWAANQRRLHQLTDLLRALQAAGLRTLVLKGAALAVLHYAQVGLRPMGDLDILVPTAAASQAFARLAQLGWRPNCPKTSLEHQVSVRHSLPYRGPAGQTFDLHWHVLWEGCQVDDDANFWAHSVPAQFGPVTSRALCPTDQLLHVCVHGARWDPVPTLRWVADAMQVLGPSAEAIDWIYLLRQTHALRVALPMRDTLTYLREVLSAPIPLAVIHDLTALPTSATERDFYRWKAGPHGVAGGLPLEWYHYRMIAEGAHRGPTLVGFWKHLQTTWCVRHAWQLPGVICGKVIQHINIHLNRGAAH